MCPRSFSGAPRQSHLYGIYRLYMFRPKHRVRSQSCSFIALEGKLLSLYILNSQFPPVSNTDGLLILISSFTSSLIKWMSPADSTHCFRMACESAIITETQSCIDSSSIAPTIKCCVVEATITTRFTVCRVLQPLTF